VTIRNLDSGARVTVAITLRPLINKTTDAI